MCGLGQPWEEMTRSLWVEGSQPGKEPRSRVAKALDGFAKERPRAEVAFSLCLADPTWPQMEVGFAVT